MKIDANTTLSELANVCKSTRSNMQANFDMYGNIWLHKNGAEVADKNGGSDTIKYGSGTVIETDICAEWQGALVDQYKELIDKLNNFNHQYAEFLKYEKSQMSLEDLENGVEIVDRELPRTTVELREE